MSAEVLRLSSRRGVALILVLWLVVVLGTIGTGVVMRTRSSTAIASNIRAAIAARYAAESGIEVTVAAIEDTLAALEEGGARADFLNALERGHAGHDSIELGDARAATAIVDVSARLDVNSAIEGSLRAFFARFSDLATAAPIARAIRDDIETGAPTGTSGEAFPRPDGFGGFRFVRPLRSLEELRSRGLVPERILDRAVPYLTVDGDGGINRRTASDTVLAAAAGDLRDEPSRLLLVGRGWTRGHPLTHEIQAVYAISGTRLVLVHWRERDR